MLSPVEQWNKPWLFRYIGDFTTQLCGDCNKPVYGSQLNNQYVMESKAVFFLRGLTYLCKPTCVRKKKEFGFRASPSFFLEDFCPQRNF